MFVMNHGDIHLGCITYHRLILWLNKKITSYSQQFFAKFHGLRAIQPSTSPTQRVRQSSQLKTWWKLLGFQPKKSEVY